MIYSKRYKFLYIAPPKTGTTSVEKALLLLDESAEDHSISIGSKVLKGKHFRQGILGHATAKDIKELMPGQIFNDLTVISSIRNPYDKLVSAYFYMKKRSLLKNKYTRLVTPRLVYNEFKYLSSVLIAKVLPFHLWALVYPYKSNKEYYFDGNGNRLVNYFVRTEYLESDLKLVLKQMNIDGSKIRIPHLNKSVHSTTSNYFKNSLFKTWISKKLIEDKNFYDSVSQEIEGVNTLREKGF